MGNGTGSGGTGALTRKRRRQVRRRLVRQELARSQEERIRGDLLHAAATAGADESVRWRALVRTVVTTAVLGAVVCGVAGLVAGIARPAYRAQAVVKVLDVAALARGSTQDAGADERTAAVQEAVAWLSGPDLHAEVARRIDGAVPRLAFTQVDTGLLLSIEAAGPSRTRVLAATRATVTAYRAHAKKAAGHQLDGRQAALENRLRDLKDQLQFASGKDRTDAIAEFDRLAAQRSSILLGSGLATRGPTVVQPAASVPAPVGPVWARYAAPALPAGALLGALAGLVLALARRHRPAIVRGRRDLAGLGVPVLQPSLMRAPARWAERLLTGRRPARTAWAAGLVLAGLRTRRIRSIAVVGPVAGSGATCAAVHLAAAAAQDGPALLVCAEDLATGEDRTARRLGVTGGVGIAPFGAGRTITPGRIETAARRTGADGLSLLVGGGSDDGPTDLAEAMRRGLLTGAAAAFRTVVVDVPPVAVSASGLEACAAADATVLVLGHGRTTAAEAASACETLRGAGATVAGVVLAHPPRSGHRARSRSQQPVTRRPDPTVTADAWWLPTG